MSVHSDDTDLLLLIPPDFFVVPSDTEEEKINLSKVREELLVSDLLTQVNDLEGRICLIENQNILNLNQMAKNGNLQRLKHFGSADTLNTAYKSKYNFRSLQATPLKSHTLPSPFKNWEQRVNYSMSKLKKNLDKHQNILTSNEYINQKEKDDQMLSDIHNFFKNRQGVHAVKEAGNEEDTEKSDLGGLHLSTAVFNLNKVNDLLKQLEDTQSEIEQKLRLKGLTAVEDHSVASNIIDKDVPSFSKNNSDDSVNESQVESKTFKRFLNFNDLSPHKNEKMIDSKQQGQIVDGCCDQNLELNIEEIMRDGVSEGNATNKLSGELTDLLSLGKLWGNAKKGDDTKHSEDLKTLKQKYQEEQCRRQHCEDLIKKLQGRLLEEQQKVAVAIRVDEEKDQAISKLTEGWNKLVNYWKNLESQRFSLEKRLEAERDKFDSEVSAACQTVKRYEMELSKALDLAHGYKEKCELSEKEKKNTSKEMEGVKNELKALKEKLQGEKHQREKLEKLLATKEESLTQAMTKICEMQNQIRDQKKNLKDRQTELEMIKVEKDKYCDMLKEEKNRSVGLEQSKKALLQANEEMKRKEKYFKENMKAMDKIKVELKEFYQDQVEKIVKEKLKEFQEQLSAAERSFQKEIEDKERTISEMAFKQVQQVIEKHMVEVNILEEKHREEIELWKIKAIRSEQTVSELQKKLDQYSSQKSEIAQKLQTIMEAQWQEALKIITASSPQQQVKQGTLNECITNPDRGFTRQNTFTMTSYGLGDGDQNKNGQPPRSLSPIGESSFCQDADQIRLGDGLKSLYEESHAIGGLPPQKLESRRQGDPLRKYIQMLLERPPGLPMEDSIDTSVLIDENETPNTLQWQHILTEQPSHEIRTSNKQKHLLDSYKQLDEKILWK